MTKRMKTRFLLTAAALILTSGIATAQETPASPPVAQSGGSAQQPIEITATKTVEWLRDQKQYVARENVIVTQGAMTLKSDLLTADYREGATSSMEIWQMTADGNVTIADQQNTAYGDKAVYDVPKGTAVLTGQNLKLVSPDQTVTARDRMEYYANERMAKAIGNAKVVRTKDTLTAATITAYFKDDAAKTNSAKPQKTGGSEALGGGSLDRLEAEGGVVIKTPTETLHGTRAIYRAASNTAEIIGKVKIERGENVLEGERAEVNLTTNVSKMFGSEKPGGRVRGVFFPSSDKQTNAGTKGQDNTSRIPAPVITAPAAPKAPVAPSAPTIMPPAAIQPEKTDSAIPVPADPAKVSPRIEY